MKIKVVPAIIAILLVGSLVYVVIQFADDTIAPLFLNSRIERLGEQNLPKIAVERGALVYCRMKADDFRFPLPVGSRATNMVVTGGFDTVRGSLEACFDQTNGMTAGEYESFLSGKVQVGGRVTAETLPGGLLIKFEYCGDQ